MLIRNTSVIDVENKKLLPPQDVLVRDGIVTAVGKNLKALQGTQIIGWSANSTAEYFVTIDSLQC